MIDMNRLSESEQNELIGIITEIVEWYAIKKKHHFDKLIDSPCIRDLREKYKTDNKQISQYAINVLSNLEVRTAIIYMLISDNRDDNEIDSRVKNIISKLNTIECNIMFIFYKELCSVVLPFIKNAKQNTRFNPIMN